jgi:acetyl esterase/lipase
MRRVAIAALLVASALTQAQERIRDVIYLHQAGCAYTMDVFKPKTSNKKALIWMVSGGWVSNVESINPDLAKTFTDRGYTVFEVVHGAQPKFQIPEIIAQVRRAVRFVRANADVYGIDPNEIGVSGASAGGHLSLEIAGLGDDGNPSASDPVEKASSKVQAVVAFFPPTDFLNWGATGVTPFKIPMMAIFMPAFGVTAASPEDKVKQLGHDLSPVNLINPSFPPTLIVHGDKDPLVPVQQAHLIDDAFDKAKIQHNLVIVPGGGHDAKTMIGGLQNMIAWFDKYLTPKS